MLVLTRKLQQQIKIGEQITVTILRVKGNTVRVGVQAPREVRVVRGELPKNAAAAADAVATEEVVVAIGEVADHSAEPVEEAASASGSDSSEAAATVAAVSSVFHTRICLLPRIAYAGESSRSRFRVLAAYVAGDTSCCATAR